MGPLCRLCDCGGSWGPSHRCKRAEVGLQQRPILSARQVCVCVCARIRALSVDVSVGVGVHSCVCVYQGVECGCGCAFMRVCAELLSVRGLASPGVLSLHNMLQTLIICCVPFFLRFGEQGVLKSHSKIRCFIIIIRQVHVLWIKPHCTYFTTML